MSRHTPFFAMDMELLRSGMQKVRNQLQYSLAQKFSAIEFEVHDFTVPHYQIQVNGPRSVFILGAYPAQTRLQQSVIRDQ